LIHLANKTAAILRGDGTGRELVEAMIKVLRACNTKIELVLADAGSEWWQETGGNSIFQKKFGNYLRIVMLVLKVLLLLSLNQMHHGALP
jgi:isocitrate dehydrogenase (NAD+)